MEMCSFTKAMKYVFMTGLSAYIYILFGSLMMLVTSVNILAAGPYSTK